MVRPLNYFEKGFIAQQNAFFMTAEMAARSKARYLAALETAPPFYTGVDFEKVQTYARQVLDSGVGDQRELARNFLQYHTLNIDTDSVGVNETINVQLIAQLWSVADADFDQFMDYVFKARG